MLKRLFLLMIVFSLILAPCALAAEVAVTVDGQQVVFPDQAPVVDANSRVLVPIRYVMELMGVDVVWEPLSSQAVLSKEDNTAIFTIGSNTYTVNGENRIMDTAPIALNNRTLFPVRYAVEAFEGSVNWDGPNNTVVVNAVATNPPLDNTQDQQGYPLAINGLLPGATLDDAKALWGEPDLFTEDPEVSNIVIYTFGTVHCDVYNGEQIVAIRTDDPADSTGFGIHPGDPVPDLMALYGEPFPAAADNYDNESSLYKWHYGYVNATDMTSTQLAVGTGYYHITFWCHGTQNKVYRIESSYGYR